MEISITRTATPRAKVPPEKLGFGSVFSDHMFVMPYEEGKGWHGAKVIPFDDFRLSPAALVFHYAQECFEGMKAYRRADGGVQLFRPGRNAARMASTHRRLCIPEIPEDDFVQAVKALVDVERDWVPSAPDTSLYIRPTTIATEAVLGVKPSRQYLFFIICSPSGPYYAEGLNPVKIFVGRTSTPAPRPAAPGPLSAGATTRPRWRGSSGRTKRATARCCGWTAPSAAMWKKWAA